MNAKALCCGIAFAVTCLVPVATRADGDASAKPLRHLRYNVSVGIHTNQRGVNFNGPVVTANDLSTVTGSIEADVVGLAANDALVFRISESADNRKEPPVKVGVLSQGQISVDPKDAANLNDEEMALLSLLGRAVVANHDLSPGYEWKVAHDGGQSSDSTTYRVLSLVGDSQVNLEIERTVKAGGAQPFDVTAHGKVLYDYKRSVPVSAQLSQRIHMGRSDSLTTTDMSFEYHLVEDSLAKT
jgi:hypothetical protein